MPAHVVYKPIEEMNDDELMEACKDFFWRIRNLYWVVNEEGEVVLFIPNDVQEQFLEELWFRNVVPKARQRGFTTLMQILMLDYCMFEDNFTCCLVSENLELAKRTMKNKFKFAYDRLPAVLRAMNPIEVNNKEEIVFENGSSLYVSTSPRGDTLQFLHVSELGKISLKHPEKAAEISSGGFTTVDKTGIIVVESTVDSAAGLFPDMCREAMRHADSGKRLAQPEYKLHFASWYDADKYEIDPTDVVITSIDHAYFDRKEVEMGIELSMRKRAWYVVKRSSDYAGDDGRMKSQFPISLEEAFEVSSEGLWLSREMAAMRTSGRLGKVPYNPSKPVNFFWDLGVDDDMAIWCHQENGQFDNFIGFVQGNNRPYAYFLSELQKKNYGVWGTFYLPHDGNHRHQGAHAIKTPKDMLVDLDIADRQIEVLPRISNVVAGINQLRDAMALYYIDKDECSLGVEHLDSFSKHWNTKLGIYEDRMQKDGHQHASDALRQHAQMRYDIEYHRQRKETAAKNNAIPRRQKNIKRRRNANVV